eukprot:6491824-Amphidinium_carterae.3
MAQRGQDVLHQCSFLSSALLDESDRRSQVLTHIGERFVATHCTHLRCLDKGQFEVAEVVIPHMLIPPPPQIEHDDIAEPLPIDLDGLVLHMRLAPLVEHGWMEKQSQLGEPWSLLWCYGVCSLQLDGFARPQTASTINSHLNAI